MPNPNDPTNWYTAAAQQQAGGAPPATTTSSSQIGGGKAANAQLRATTQGGAANPYGDTGATFPATAGGVTAGGYDTTYLHLPGATSRQVINPDTGTTYADAWGTPRTFTGSGGLSQFGNPNLALLGGDPNNMGAGVGGQQSYANQQNQQLQAMAGNVAGRQGPQMNQNAVNMMAPGVNQGIDLANRSNLTGIQALQTADRSNLYAVQNALDTRGLAQGPAITGQMNAAGQLAGMAQMPAGPSVAEQQLRMGADRSMQQQMAMASGARGGNAGLALQNAAANQGQTMGDLNQQQALLRAQEDMANRQFAAGALQGASNIYGAANQGQLGAYGQAANIFGNVAGNQVSQAGQLGNIANNQVAQGQLALGLTNTYADMAGKQLGADVSTQGQNDATAINLMNMGYGLQNQDRMAALAQQQGTEDLNARLYAMNKGVEQATNQRSDENFWKTLGAATAGGSTFLSSLGNIGSDIRMKREISPAGEDVSDAFRAANRDARTIRDTQVEYPYAPAYGYQYRDPGAPGAAPGRHYGPMAQDLEKTPAGASVVQTGPDGKKSIDTQRLTLLNASETAKMRRELDAIKGMGDTIRDTYIPKPLGGASDTHLRPELAPRVPAGVARPYAPGEYTENPDGSWSSERSMTVQNRDGSWSVIPSIYLKDGRPYEARDERDASRLAAESKLPFRRFKDLDTAEKYSIDREAAWQPIENPADASKIEPLWAKTARLDAQNARDTQTLAQIDAAQRAAQTAMARPTTPYPYGGYGY